MLKCDSNPKAELDKFTLQVLRCCSVQGDKLQPQSSACAPEAPWCLPPAAGFAPAWPQEPLGEML